MELQKNEVWSAINRIIFIKRITDRHNLKCLHCVVVGYVMCPDSLNWVQWVRFHGRYWYQSFLDMSNIWGAGRTDPWGPEMDHPPLGRSYLVVMPSYDMSCVLILLTGFNGWYFMAVININPSSMGPIFGVWIGPTLGVPKWTILHWDAAIW